MQVQPGIAPVLGQPATTSPVLPPPRPYLALQYGANSCSQSPASSPNSVGVASSTAQDTISSFSNVGSCVKIFGPGSTIVSAGGWACMGGGGGGACAGSLGRQVRCLHGSEQLCALLICCLPSLATTPPPSPPPLLPPGITSDTAEAIMSGTSMASPHVAGAMALVLQAHPAASVKEARDILLAAAAPVSFSSSTPPRLLQVRGWCRVVVQAWLRQQHQQLGAFLSDPLVPHALLLVCAGEQGTDRARLQLRATRALAFPQPLALHPVALALPKKCEPAPPAQPFGEVGCGLLVGGDGTSSACASSTSAAGGGRRAHMGAWAAAAAALAAAALLR